ncbi:carboxylesterase/lipase family protein [Phytoactinopolyspora mesophila]|uniref:Carboxylic ester hydrolase n=1 Tax=Phytoactinopolyspora mesophila TaxID=2650750 RepID=A0A7K3MAQ4_9ACTN|nr:carboxylesterase family protein [Phytoactinopolyspora mesophila]NDL60395.1 carboxylesterase family protein [Phytoactinopolyspora mesophila]
MRQSSTRADGTADGTGAVVKTRYGLVRGRATAGVHAFLGLPYAAPPFGANRFRPPQPVEPWNGIREAVDFGATPPQSAIPPPHDVFYPLVPGEDCLNLNIWSADLGRAGQPVMVWIPGGGFDGGASGLYDGSRFARDGVVCVTINTRRGADGFLDLGDGVTNMGLLDPVAALIWVQENIAAFGGDPGNVTIFGESAGAMLVGTLLGMPAARGLFQRAIMQSGAGNMVFTSDTAQDVSHRLATALGVAPERRAIADVPVKRLLDAQPQVAAELAAHPDATRWGGEPGARVNLWQPVVDGVVLPDRPIETIKAGASAEVDVLIGQNAEEGRLSLVPFGLLDQITDEQLAAAMAAYGLPIDRALGGYREAYPGAGPGDLLSILQGDWYYRIPAIRLAEARGGVAPTYMYEFTWRSPQFDGLLGACHFLEVPFVFDVLDDERMQLLTGAEPPQPLADTMHEAWVSFAATGDPGWPSYRPARRTVIRFADVSGLVDDPHPIRPLWDGLRSG